MRSRGGNSSGPIPSTKIPSHLEIYSSSSSSSSSFSIISAALSRASAGNIKDMTISGQEIEVPEEIHSPVEKRIASGKKITPRKRQSRLSTGSLPSEYTNNPTRKNDAFGGRPTGVVNPAPRRASLPTISSSCASCARLKTTRDEQKEMIETLEKRIEKNQTFIDCIKKLSENQETRLEESAKTIRELRQVELVAVHEKYEQSREENTELAMENKTLRERAEEQSGMIERLTKQLEDAAKGVAAEAEEEKTKLCRERDAVEAKCEEKELVIQKLLVRISGLEGEVLAGKQRDIGSEVRSVAKETGVQQRDMVRKKSFPHLLLK
eukprot:Nk52_evm32s226 gene=Nk52_evmTU32s226